MTQTLTTTCNDREYEIFSKLCENCGYTTEDALRLFVREACNKRKLPIDYDYENPETIYKKIIESYDVDYIVSREQFIEWVKDKIVTDYDGTGYMSDGIYKYHEVICDVDWINDQPEIYRYVVWYNE